MADRPFDVTTLAFSEDRWSKGQRALHATDAGEHHQAVARNGEVELRRLCWRAPRTGITSSTLPSRLRV